MDVICFSSPPQLFRLMPPQFLRRDFCLLSTHKSSQLLCRLVCAGNSNHRSRCSRHTSTQTEYRLSYIFRRMETLELHIQPSRQSYKSSEVIQDIRVFLVCFQESFSSFSPFCASQIVSRILQHNFAASASSLFSEPV